MVGESGHWHLPSVNVDVILAGFVVAIVGVAVGLAAGLAFRFSERDRRGAAQFYTHTLPQGVDDVLSALRSSAIVLDEELNLVKASAAAYAFGLVRGDRIVVPDLVDLAGAVVRTGEIHEVQLELERSRHSTRKLYVLARLAPLTSRYVLVLVEDRTRAVRLDEVRRDFVANVSHELKTPVGALMLLAEAVAEASDDPEAVRRFATQMEREGVRLSHLVEEIINLSRLQYDDPVDSPHKVEVDHVVEAAIDRSRVDAENRQVRLTSGGDIGLMVLGNEHQLTVAVGNLVENAVSYSPPHTRVAIAARAGEDVVEISVTDQGDGIAKQDQERIFERFYRVDPARSRDTGGTGLGLSIVKHIAASHGGEVALWSVPGAGSTFTLRLPRHPDSTDPLVNEGSRTEPPQETPQQTLSANSREAQ
jgi:two-component system sensor histidine kinase SenX3